MSRLLESVVLLTAVLLIFGCINPNNSAASDSQVELELQVRDLQGQSLLFQTRTFDTGTSCLAAMRSITAVETENTAFGPMIVGIAGVQSSRSNYWAFYINDAYATYGIADCRLDADTAIRWQLEEIQNNFPQ